MSRKIKKTKYQKKHILIALEDTKSSRFYIKDLLKDKGIIPHIVFAKHIGTDPRSVLKAIEQFEKENPHIKYDKAWLIIDKDSFSKDNFKGTLETARQKDICVAYSNECYELWLLLHFKDVTSYKTREDIRKELNEEFQKNFNLKYEKSEKHVYGMLIDRQEKAIQRAKTLIENILKIDGKLDPYNNNPSTKIYLLIECLNNLEKCKKMNYFDCNKI
jgi:hypothetical protein